MPIYEFVCSRCGERFELLLPMSKAQEKASCPKCGGEGTRRPSTFSSLSKGSESSSSCSTCSATSCSICGG